jgi:mersacidin/lichenicidin family type 2 lantibiotic
MSNDDIIRAWKDEDYWASLDEQKRSQLPENPAGEVEEIVELTSEELEELRGGFGRTFGGETFCHPNTSFGGETFCHPNTYLPNGICIDPKMTKSSFSCLY